MKAKGRKEVEALKTTLAEAIGERIERLKASNGITQSAVARRLGITQPRLSYLRSGKLEQFSVDYLVQVAVGLGLSVHFRIARPYRSQPGAK